MDRNTNILLCILIPKKYQESIRFEAACNVSACMTWLFFMNLLEVPYDIHRQITQYLQLDDVFRLTRVCKVLRNTFSDYALVIKKIIDDSVYGDLEYLELIYNSSKFKELLFVINDLEDVWELRKVLNQKVLKLGLFSGFFAVGTVSRSYQMKLENVIMSYLKNNRRGIVDYQVLAVSCEYGFKKVVEFIFKEDRVGCLSNLELPLVMSASFGHVEVLQLFLSNEKEGSYPSKFYEMALVGAASKCQLETLGILLADPRCNPAYLNNRALEIAVKSGYDEIVNCLLQDNRVRTTAGLNHLLSLGCEAGHFKVVQHLLKLEACNPAAFDCVSIRKAIKARHIHVAELLLKDNRVPEMYRKSARIKCFYASLAIRMTQISAACKYRM